VAFHPGYATNGAFFVYYTDNFGDLVLARYQVSPDPAAADPASGEVLLTIPHPGQANHNGGQLQFGPDGFLYVAVGDGGGVGDEEEDAQNLGNLLGKILRLDVDGAAPYAIPPGNPFAATPGARPEIWALGLRNPWRFSFDRATGVLTIGDVGQGTREEVNVQPAGVGGLNYCWPRLEGTHVFRPETPCTEGAPTGPLLEYATGVGDRCAVTGGYVHRGASGALPAGTYVFGDFCSGEIFVTQGAAFSVLLDTSLSISSFGEDEAGEVYVADLGGGVFRLTFEPATVTLAANLATLATGDTLQVAAALHNPLPFLVADVYAGVLLPDGDTVAFLTALSPLAVTLLSAGADPASFPPLVAGLALAIGDAALADFLTHTFGGAEPPGLYQLFVAVLRAGALLDGSLDADDLVALDFRAFTFVP
jgi:hypothetical protein